jgi:hypothetical protein
MQGVIDLPGPVSPHSASSIGRRRSTLIDRERAAKPSQRLLRGDP